MLAPYGSHHATLIVGNGRDENAATYTVTVNNITGDGLSIKLAPSTNIQDAAGNVVALAPNVSEVVRRSTTWPRLWPSPGRTPPTSPTNAEKRDVQRDL